MADVKINPENNKFFKKEVKYLGHVILKKDQSMDKEKTEITASRPVSRNRKQVRSFLGFCSYYHRFVKG